jgi:hypothetical protein
VKDSWAFGLGVRPLETVMGDMVENHLSEQNKTRAKDKESVLIISE